MRKSALPNLVEKTMVDYDNMLFGYLPRCGSAGNNIEVCWMGLLLTTKKADKNEGAKMVDQHFHEQFAAGTRGRKSAKSIYSSRRDRSFF